MSEHDTDAVVERIAKVMGQGWGAVIDTLALLKPGDDLGNGLVAVPREPTEAMDFAGAMEHDDCDGLIERPEIAHFIYRAMIAAAAEPTTREPNADER